MLETPGMEKFSLSNLKLQNYKQLKTKSCNGKCKAILGSDDTNSSVYYNVKNKERQEEGKKKTDKIINYNRRKLAYWKRWV